MSVKALIARGCSFGRQFVPASRELLGRRRVIWLAVLVAGVVSLSSCATLTKQISYGGHGKIDLTESGVTSAQFSLEFGLDSSK